MDMKPRTKMFSWMKGLAIVLFWLAVWWLLAVLVNKELLLPDPVAVGKRFGALVVTAAFWQTVTTSLLRIVIGFALGILGGMALALLMYKSKIAFALFSPLVKAVRAAPVVSFIILALVWLATTRIPIFISFLMVLPVAWENTFTGLMNIDKQLLEMAEVFRVSSWRRFWCIYLPSLRPYIMAAATSGMGLAWKSGITAEVIASPRLAIGTELQAGKVYLETADVFLWTVVVVILSICLEKLLHRLLKGRAV